MNVKLTVFTSTVAGAQAQTCTMVDVSRGQAGVNTTLNGACSNSGTSVT